MVYAILIAGTRTYNDYIEFKTIVDKMLTGIINDGYDIAIIQGDAKGADFFADKYAKERKYIHIGVPADWDSLGNGAGYARNSKMHKFLINFEKRACLCFWDGKSSGTKHNFKLAKENNTSLKVYDYVQKKFITPTIN